MNKKQTNWEDYLPILEFAYNSAKHVSTNFSPFMLMYGFQPRSPVTVGLTTEKIQHVKDFLQDHMDVLKIAHQNVRQAQDRYILITRDDKLSSRKVTLFFYVLLKILKV